MSVRNRAIRLALEASQMPVEERVLVVDVLLFGREIPDSPPGDEIGDMVARIEDGEMSARDIERVACSIASRTPPRDREEWHFLIRQFVRRRGAKSASMNATIQWLTVECARFVGGADWKVARHHASCTFPDEHRLLLWRILKFGRLPGRSTLFEILNPDQ